MASTVLTGIGELTTNDDELGTPHDAALVIDGALVAWVGAAASAPAADQRVELDGRAVLPGWVDSHTHLLFAGDRTAEFAARMAGQPYQAGGIATTVAATRQASDEELAGNLDRLATEAARQGTTCLETKTGYGLTTPTRNGPPRSPRPTRWWTRSASSAHTSSHRAATRPATWTW